MPSTPDISAMVFAIPARVLRPDAARQADLMTRIAEMHVLDPAILTERTPFFWGAEISSDLVDSHFTHMLQSTLTNFRDDARAGVAFLPGHKHYELPFGRSFDASLEQTDGPPRTRVVADFYTLPGLQLNEVKTDDLIDGMRGGLLRDVSVGFGGGQFTCDICGRDAFSWECPHVPGLKYEVKEGDVVRQQLSTFSVDNARLYEVSSVFAGSTPNAEVLKATREAEVGRLKPDAISLIEAKYRVKLPAAKRAFAGVTVPGQMPREVEMMTEEQFKQLVRAIGESGVATAEERTAMTEDVAIALVERMVGRLKVAEPQAADGVAYRSDLMSEALAEGVRAYGQTFNKAAYEGMLTNAPIATLRQMRDDWKSVGDERLQGGRKSVDDAGDGKPKTAPRPLVSDSQFRA